MYISHIYIYSTYTNIVYIHSKYIGSMVLPATCESHGTCWCICSNLASASSATHQARWKRPKSWSMASTCGSHRAFRKPPKNAKDANFSVQIISLPNLGGKWLCVITNWKKQKAQKHVGQTLPMVNTLEWRGVTYIRSIDGWKQGMYLPVAGILSLWS